MLKTIASGVLFTLISTSAWAAGADLRVLEAAKNQDKTALRALLKQRADVNAADVDGMTALILAAHLNDLEMAKLLLASGANAKAANRYAVTALAEACNASNGELIEALLKAGADPNAAFGEGETPLMTASRTGSVSGVKALLARGANVNAKEAYRGQTALMWAVAENQAEVAKLLIAAGAEVNVQSTIFEFNFRKIAAGGTQAVYSHGGLTPLMLAARQGSLESARILIEAGADINKTEPDYDLTPLLDAIYNDHYDVAALLVDKGAKMDSALFLTVEMKNLDYFGNRPRKAVTGKMDETAFIKHLLAHGADPNGPMLAKLPPRQSQVGVVLPFGNTPFLRAARSADVETLKLLLEKGADPNRASNDKTTPVITAATGQGARFAGGAEHPEADFIEALKLLVAHGADVNAVTDRGETAMHGAAQRGADLIVQFLADHGAKLDVKNKQGRTPLDVAMGVGGVANTGGNVRLSTADLIRRLMAGPTAKKD